MQQIIGVAFHFVDGDLHQIVASHAGAYGNRLEKRGAVVAEEVMPTRVLN